MDFTGRRSIFSQVANQLKESIQKLCNAIRSLPGTDEPLQQFDARGLDRGKYDATLPIRENLSTILDFLEPFEENEGAAQLAELPALHVNSLVKEIEGLQTIVDEIPVKCQKQTTMVVPPGYWGDEPAFARRVQNAHSRLYSELASLRRLAVDALTKRASGVSSSPTAGLTGWSRVRRCGGSMRRQLETATTEEEFQTVGLLCREILISLAEAVYVRAKHPPIDGVEPSATDADRMLSAYFAVELAGGSNEATRAHAKTSLKLAVELQHRRTASYRDAALCAEATRTVVNIVAIISGTRLETAANGTDTTAFVSGQNG
jgi:hypothetical protein